MNNYLLIQSAGSPIYQGDYTDYYESVKPIPLGTLKKDYFQGIQLLPYEENNKYGVTNKICHFEVLEDEECTEIYLDELLIARVKRSTSSNTATLDILGEFDRVIILPDWNIRKLEISIKGNLKYTLENNRDRISSRYLFAFMTSSKEDFFVSDPTGQTFITCH